MVSRRSYSFITAFIILIHFSILLFLGLFRHWGYITSINDLAVFDQAVWGILNGECLLNTAQMNEPINWLGFHFHPFLFFFVPLYFLFSSPFWFILAQAFALSAAAWPVFLLAKHQFRSEQTGLIWVIIFLTNPFLLNAAAWDFHPVSLAVPFVCLCLLGIRKEDFILLIISSLFILTVQEHFGLMVVGFAILWSINTRRWIPGIALFLLGVGHFYLVLQVIMPAFSPIGQHVMVSEGLGHLSRYSWLGDSIGDIIQTIIIHPFAVLKIAMPSGAFYLFFLLLPFLFFPLIGLSFLLPGIADLAANMLSANPMPRSIIGYHSVTLIPIFAVAAMYGVKRASRWVKRYSPSDLSLFVLTASAVMGYSLAPFPLPGAKNVWAPASFLSWPDPRVKEIRTLVGNDGSISVQANIGAHFSQRKEIYRYPNRIDQVAAVVLRLVSPTKNIHNYPEEKKEQRQHLLGMLDSHLQMDRDDFLASVEALLRDKDFGIIYWNNPWLVLKRDADAKEVIPDVMSKLAELKEKWR
jgi:uncharacterized membrane protein